MKPDRRTLNRRLAAAAFAVCVPLGAQGQDEQTPVVLEAVTVTATKVGESDLMRTPLSVTAFNDAYLEDMVVANIRDLVLTTPGLMISQNTDLAQIYIRGVGSNNVFAGSDPSSTIHQDGVYLARPQNSFGNFLDVERIEVLRGPQGTLYGRNSVGGTINIISKRPSLTSLEALGRLTVGNENLWRAETYVNGALTDTVAGSLALQRSQRDPYRQNVAPTGNDVDDEDVKSARAQLLWKATDSAEVLLRGDYYEDDTQLYGGNSPIVPPTSPAPLARSIVGDPGKVALNGPSRAQREAAGTSAEVNLVLSDRWTLKSLSAYRDNSYAAISDPDGTELDINRTLLTEDQKQYSQEFNLIGSYERLQWFLGAFYFAEDVDSTIEVQARAANLSTIFAPHLDTDTWAVFGQVEYGVTDRLSLTLGGRYTDERKRWARPAGRFVTDTSTRTLDLTLLPQIGDYEEFTPRVGFEYAMTEESLLYGSVSRGFKSGGFNITSTRPGGYDPETMLAYEVGWKSRFGGRLQMSLSAFHYDYEDLQVQAFIVPGTADITNAASAKINGSELEMLAQVTDGLRLGIGVAYLDATYDDYRSAPIGGGLTIDASGNRLNNSPEWSANASAEYVHALGSGRLRVSAEYGWKSEVFFTTSNNPREHQDGYGVGNASIGYESGSERLEVSLWARNLADEAYVTGAGTIVNTTGRYGPPRTYGLAVTVRY